MRFMTLYKPGTENDMPTEKEMAAVGELIEEMAKAGTLITTDGLQPSSKGARVSFSGGRATVTDGPFTEAKEVLGGYWMIDVKSKEEAIAWAMKCPGSSNETIEIRQVQEMADFPPDVQKAAAGFAELKAGPRR